MAEGFHQPGLLAPLAKAHAGFPLEEAGQGAGTGGVALGQGFQGVLLIRPGQLAAAQAQEPGLAGHGQVQGGNLEKAQFLKRQTGDHAAPAAQVVSQGLFEQGKNEGPQQGPHFHQAAVGGQGGSGVGANVESAHFHRPQHHHLVVGFCRNPDAPHRRHHPTAGGRFHPHDAPAGVDELGPGVAMHRGGAALVVPGLGGDRMGQGLMQIVVAGHTGRRRRRGGCAWLIHDSCCRDMFDPAILDCFPLPQVGAAAINGAAPHPTGRSDS